MALFLNEEEVVRLLPMDECIQALERAFLNAASGATEVKPRSRMVMPNGMFHFMAAADAGSGVFGYKAYPSFAASGGAKMVVMLYDYDTGRLISCMEGGRLGQIRTGAASGLATKFMAREDSVKVGVIGSGFQARTQLEAVCAVRSVSQVKVYSRRQERREQFAARMGESLGIDIVPVAHGQDCASDADVLLVITSSREPVLEGEWLEPGVHVNAAGGNHWMRRELDQAAVERADLIVVDDLEQAKIECGDLMWPQARGAFRWDMARQLQDVVSGTLPGRPSPQSITLFESMGIGLEDIAAAQVVYQNAVEQGIGQELPF